MCSAPGLWTMRAAGCVAMLSLSMLTMVATAAPADGLAPCSMTVEDERDDVIIQPSQSPYSDAPEGDFLSYTLARTATELWLNVTLAASPLERTNGSFQYWIGFDVKGTGKEPAYMDARISPGPAPAGSLGGSYADAALVSPNSYGNERLGDLPVTWDGPSLAISVNWEMLTGYFGEDVAVGNPSGMSDGVNRATPVFGGGVAGAAPYVTDHIYVPSGDFVALGDCASSPASSNSVSEASRQVSGMSPLLLGAAAFVALLLFDGRRRRKAFVAL